MVCASPRSHEGRMVRRVYVPNVHRYSRVVWRGGCMGNRTGSMQGIKGKASRASKVTTNYSLHSARSIRDRVIGLLDRPEAKNGGVGKGKGHNAGPIGPAGRAVCFTDILRGASWCASTPRTLEAILAAAGCHFKGVPRTEREHQTFRAFREEKKA